MVKKTTPKSVVVSPSSEGLDLAAQDLAFKSQKPIPKKEVMKLKPGTWIEVKWLDVPNEAVLLLKRPQQAAGDVDLLVYSPASFAVSGQVHHNLVVKVLGTLKVPSLVEGGLSRDPRLDMGHS